MPALKENCLPSGRYNNKITNYNNNSIINKYAMSQQKDYLNVNAELEHVLGELASTSDMDFLQVFKNFESVQVGTGNDNLCELASGISIFNYVDCMNVSLEDVGLKPTFKSGDEENIENSNQNDNEDDEVNNDRDDIKFITKKQDKYTNELRSEIDKRMQPLYKKCQFLLRRLRKLQARHMGKHINEEINGLFEYTQQFLKRRNKECKSITTMTSLAQLQIEKQKQFVANTMKGLMKRIEQISTNQQSSLPPNRIHGQLSSNATTKSTSASNSMIAAQNDHNMFNSMQLIPTFDLTAIQQIEHTSGLLHTELKTVQKDYDSDVTASSSGGESADDMITYNNQYQHPISISKRAAYRWARDRANIAARWNWLLSQISDLEFKIRQQNELHRQIKKNKGTVCFDVVNNANEQLSASDGILSPNSKSNEIDLFTIKQDPVKTVDYDQLLIQQSSNENEEGSSWRTRPFQRSTFRKRRLLQTTNLHTISKKAARPSSVKCGCQWPFHPCALCTGRQDPTAPRNLPDMMSLQERVASLDPCFHPNISFPDEISHSVHLEGAIRLPDWQNRAIRCKTKIIPKMSAIPPSTKQQNLQEYDHNSQQKMSTNKPNDTNQHDYVNLGTVSEPGRKYKIKSKLNLVANKLKNVKNRQKYKKYTKLLKKNSNNYRNASKSNSNAVTPSSTSGSETNNILLHHDENNFGIVGGTNNNYKYEKFGYTEKKNKNSYDIHNIVIPYSVAAATRVEILPYKEVPTPKWRLVGDKEEINVKDIAYQTKPNEAIESSVEDISLDTIQMRHERALIEERKKFSTYLKFPWSTRSRANRRIDSLAESSGGNTPDTMSPNSNIQNVCGGDQESIPSPAASTAMTLLDNENCETLPVSSKTNLTLPNASTLTTAYNSTTTTTTMMSKQLTKKCSLSTERRRTLSAARKHNDGKDDAMHRSNTPDLKETIPPYEPYEFPLSDDIYEKLLKSMHSRNNNNNVTHNHRSKNNHHDSIATVDDNEDDEDDDDGGMTYDDNDEDYNFEYEYEEEDNNDDDDDDDVDEDYDYAETGVHNNIVKGNNNYEYTNVNHRHKSDYKHIHKSQKKYIRKHYEYMKDESDFDSETLEAGMQDEDPNDPEWIDLPNHS